MSTTIARGKLFRCTTEVDDDRLRQMRRAPEAANDAMLAGAQYWHSGVLPPSAALSAGIGSFPGGILRKHFEPGADSRYGYAPRSVGYLKQARKSGKPGLVYSGSMRQDLRANGVFRPRSGGQIDVVMSARVLRLATNMPENSADLYVTHGNRKKGTLKNYPNLKREVKQVTDDEQEAVAQVVTSSLEQAFGPSPSTN